MRAARRLSIAFAVASSLVVAPVAGASAVSGVLGGRWSPPVAGAVVRGFEPPASRFGPGHLGVDYGVPPGTAVRAAGDGVVVFAGRVGTGLHVVIRHAGDIRTTESFLATIAVVEGQVLRRGAVVGTSGGTGPGHAASVLHFGVRVGDEFIDPMLLFGPPDLVAVVHLAEPRGSSSGSDAVDGDERAALADSIAVDGRTVGPPPSWWSDASIGSSSIALVGSAKSTVEGARLHCNPAGSFPGLRIVVRYQCRSRAEPTDDTRP